MRSSTQAQVSRVSCFSASVAAVQDRLDEFEIPVAEHVPDEMVDRACGVIEAIGGEAGVDLGGGARGLADDPFVDRHLDGDRIELALADAFVHLAEARGVPQLGAEIAAGLDAIEPEADVAPLPRRDAEREAQRVGAVFVDDVQRIDDVALGLGHLLPALVEHAVVDEDVAERHFVHEVQAHHHHARDPEEDDVERGDEDRGRVVARELGRFLRPAQGRERPQRGGEPGVEHVFVAHERGLLSIVLRRGRHRLGFGFFDEDVAVGSVPGRDLMAPPELARDAPGLDVAHPVEIDVLPLIGDDPCTSFLDRIDGFRGERSDVQIPLLGEIGLEHHGLGLFVMRNGVDDVLGLFEEALLFQIGGDALSRLEAIEPAIGGRNLIVQLQLHGSRC